MYAAAASASVALASSTTTEQLAQTTIVTPIATAPTAIAKVKKEMMPEAWAAKSKKWAAQRAMARQREKEKKLTEKRAKQAELQTVHARATADALAKQAALHSMAMLRGEVLNQFTADQLGSTASSVSSVTPTWRPASPALSLMHELPPNPAAPSWLGVPSPKMYFMAAGGACLPVINLNHMHVAGESSLGHIKTPRARAPEDLPDAADLFGQMPTQPMVDEVLPWSSPFVYFHLLSWHGHCPCRTPTRTMPTTA
jgi:hypothetical protein